MCAEIDLFRGLECVPGLLQCDGGRAFKTIVHELRGAGYFVWWELINARCLTAQSRNRLYFVGLRRDVTVAGNVASTADVVEPTQGQEGQERQTQHSAGQAPEEQEQLQPQNRGSRSRKRSQPGFVPREKPLASTSPMKDARSRGDDSVSALLAEGQREQACPEQFCFPYIPDLQLRISHILHQQQQDPGPPLATTNDEGACSDGSCQHTAACKNAVLSDHQWTHFRASRMWRRRGGG